MTKVCQEMEEMAIGVICTMVNTHTLEPFHKRKL
jgi:hypothetical protein